MNRFAFLVLLFLLAAPAAAGGANDSALAKASDLPVKYIGNAESHKFHRPSCPFARIMALNKRVSYHFRCEAVACGNVPCRYCLPPVWTTVKASIISPLPAPKQEEPGDRASLSPFDTGGQKQVSAGGESFSRIDDESRNGTTRSGEQREVFRSGRAVHEFKQ